MTIVDSAVETAVYASQFKDIYCPPADSLIVITSIPRTHK